MMFGRVKEATWSPDGKDGRRLGYVILTMPGAGVKTAKGSSISRVNYGYSAIRGYIENSWVISIRSTMNRNIFQSSLSE